MLKWLQDAPPIQIVFVVGLVGLVGVVGVDALGGLVDSEPAAVEESAGQGDVVASPGETSPSPEPEPTEESPEPEPSPEPPPDPVTVSGSDGNTEPFELPEGRVSVDIVTEGECYFGFSLRTMEDRGAADLPSLDGAGETSGELYGLDGGEYFLKPYTGSSCTWEVTFTPQG